ncbi:MAG TPA: DUF3750 domain-containing protein [Dongiaceae bacterium]
MLPLAISAARFYAGGQANADWRSADRSSAGILPAPTPDRDAVIRIFGARTVRWRGIFAMHCWIVVKPAGAPEYTRYDYTAWTELPVRVNGYAADGRWFGSLPETVYALDGPTAQALIPKIENAIREYPYSAAGDYRAWPGPNSNTFVQAVLDDVPELDAILPALAIGKDFPYDGKWLRPTAGGDGFRLSLGGYAGITLGWREGIALDFLGAAIRLDIRRPAVEFPGLGRFGIPSPVSGAVSPKLP